MQIRKPRRKVYQEDRLLTNFRTTQRDRDNLERAKEFFTQKLGKKVTNTQAINLSLEAVAKMTEKGHTNRRNNDDSNDARTDGNDGINDGNSNECLARQKRRDGSNDGNDATKTTDL